MTEPTTCAQQFAYCHCSLPAGHDPAAHVCDCNGSWTDTGEIILWPEGRTRAEAIGNLLGLPPDEPDHD